MHNDLPMLKFPIYSGWTEYTPVIPKLYWDVYSAEQRIKSLCLSFDKVENYLDYVAEKMNEWNIEFSEEMQAEFKALWEALDNGLENAVYEWIAKNVEYIFETIAKQVFFGLTDNGYFCAYVPESWSDIEFDTGMVYDRYDYGRLILRYNVDGSGVIDNTGRYDDANTESIIERLLRLEQRVFTNETTLYTNLNG